ncbi:MAG: KamA family radical SAM protein [Victivallaceae bacterium]|nr:KamA family radical SAM protein [Victivallaceae bacterium]
MEKWQKSLQKSVKDVGLPAKLFNLPEDKLREVAHAFQFRVSPYYFSLLREKGDAIYRQCIPDELELEGSEKLMEDPLGEDESSPVPNIVHRYPDRCLFLVSNQCAMYCRFCTRKRKFGTRDRIDPSKLEAGFDYIRQHPEIRDVLISGGDPFLLEDSGIENILKRLRAVDHIQILRLGTRTPCVLPERITVKLTRMLKKYHPLFINVHFNHPDELTPQAVKALARLADAGIPLGSQTVLLKGINDDPIVMRLLMQKLLAARVRPYYIFQADLVYGTEHFRTPISKGLEIMRQLRGWTSGLAVPYYVVDLPGGGGKIPLLPEYVRNVEDHNIVFSNYCGQVCSYPDFTGDGKAGMSSDSVQPKQKNN